MPDVVLPIDQSGPLPWRRCVITGTEEDVAIRTHKLLMPIRSGGWALVLGGPIAMEALYIGYLLRQWTGRRMSMELPTSTMGTKRARLGRMVEYSVPPIGVCVATLLLVANGMDSGLVGGMVGMGLMISPPLAILLFGVVGAVSQTMVVLTAALYASAMVASWLIRRRSAIKVIDASDGVVWLQLPNQVAADEINRWVDTLDLPPRIRRAVDEMRVAMND